MTEETPMAIYSFPTEEDFLIPMCLVLYSNIDSIQEQVLQDLISLFVDLEEAGELSFLVFSYNTRVEFHFNKLSEFSTLITLVFISSVKHSDIGDWSFMPSESSSIWNATYRFE